MQTKVQSAPANIMFVLDNSGSMDWEFMTEESSGLYNGEYYLYPDSAFINGQDRVYSDSNIVDSEKIEWKSQWSGYNKIFYNPHADYSPWPNMSEADTQYPFSNPNNNNSSDSKLNMGGEYYSVVSGAATEIIVDNQDSGFSLNTPTSWSTASNSYPHYGDNYYFTNSNNDAVDDWVTWTPGLPFSGDYTVSIWWTSNDSRDSSVYYEIYHNGTTDTVGPYNMQNNDGQWNDVGTFSFSGDGSEYVKLNPDIAGDSTYSADAVKFSQGGLSTVSIKNAHYFIINDLDEDGQKDDGEAIYLVNFVNGVRSFYLFNDEDSDNKVEDGELILTDFNDVPEKAKPAIYDEDGILTGFVTDADDLQNFANWFSYYRKRELTAKAAVAGSIASLDWVNVGFYSINSGLRQSVLPIGVEGPNPSGGLLSVIVDNRDSGYLETGNDWNESSASNEYNGSSRYTNDRGEYATWTPDLPSNGTYKVYVWYTDKGDRDSNAKYTVHHSNGDYVVRLNQDRNESTWVELGEFNFTEGTSGWVRVDRDSSSNGDATSADAVKFETTIDTGTVLLNYSETLLSQLYDMNSSGGTPLRTALNNVGRYFDQDDGNDGNLGDSPFESAENGGACQQAFTIVMTDGFWNGDSPNVGNQDQNTSNIHDGSPYADAYSNTLADVAMKYFKNDLSDSLDNIVPTNSCDKANHQHMVTYGVSFGVTGTLNPENYHSCLLDASTPSWPNPTAGNNQKIDDLYHAAVNGRGIFFSASDPQELVQSLVDVTSNIASRISSGSSVSVNGDELDTGTVLYQASYASDSWTGDVTAYPLDPETGEILKEEDDILWHASDQLQLISPEDRNIVVYDPDTQTGVEFLYDNLTANQKIQMDSSSQSVDFIRGKEISGFRSRTKKLGDIVHSAPVLMGNTIYAGGNDGMLHAFAADSGQERFAYVPNLIMDNFHASSADGESFFDSGYKHKFFVDLTPTVKSNIDIDGDGTSTKYSYLVGGLGKGGKGYYCLDITTADSKDYNADIGDIKNMVKWEYPSTTDNDIGYTFSTPVLAKTNAPASENSAKSKWAAIFGNGYGSSNGNAVLYVLGLDGSVIRKIDTGVGGCNGLSSPSVIDVDNDLRADYVYAGDLKGNLWKFDLTDPDPDNWTVAHKESGVAVPFFSVPGKPITSKPDVMYHCEAGDSNSDLECDTTLTSGFLVMFGTGKYLTDDDRTNTDRQYIFGLWDFGDDEDDQEYLGTFDKEGTIQLSNMDAGVTLLEQTEVASGYYNGLFLRTLSNNTPDWTIKCDATDTQDPDPDPSAGAHAGWFFELVGTGERIIKDVIIRNNVLIYISFTPDSSPCSGGGNSMVYEVDACSGGRLSAAQFDINGDGIVDDNDLITLTDDDGNTLTDEDGDPIKVPPSGMEAAGLLHVPVFVQIPGTPIEMKIFSSSAASTETIFEVTEPRGMFYWKSHKP